MVYAGITPEQMELDMKQLDRDLKETERRVTKVEKAVKPKKIKNKKVSRTEEQKKIDKIVEDTGHSIYDK